MLICQTISEIKSFIKEVRHLEKTVGFVPTMGYFHEGHLTLMSEAKRVCDVVVVSIFVNPLQFGPKEDYAEYPRNFKRDVKMAEDMGVDAMFLPSVEEMYPGGFSTFVEVQGLTQCLCGFSRPGHFKGVTTIVAKLFNIVMPDKAFFGQKDAQQALVIKRMVRDLNMPLEIVVMPTVREQDGLAMSSRNIYLNPQERKAAMVLYAALKMAEKAVANGEKDVIRLEQMIKEKIKAELLAKIDYVEIRSLPDLEKIDTISAPALLAMAVRFGKTRLIDNIVLNPGGVDHIFNHI